MSETMSARRALLLAVERAKHDGYDHLETEHLFLGLTEVEDCLGLRIIRDLGANLGRLRLLVGDRVKPRGYEVILLSQMRYTRQTREAVNRSTNLAQQFKDEHLGTGHLMFGLISLEESHVSNILRGSGITVELYVKMLLDYRREIPED